MYMYMYVYVYVYVFPLPPPFGFCSWHSKSCRLHKKCALVAESVSPCEIMYSGDLLLWC